MKFPTLPPKQGNGCFVVLIILIALITWPWWMFKLGDAIADIINKIME